MSWDPVSRKLPDVSPLRDPALVAAFERYEHLTVGELDAAWERINAEFRIWVDAPENAGRPFQEAPQYPDRIAIDSLLERRTWWE
ncbi:MAG: hypothetical protein R2878_09930 [Thermoleophilia bacterium]